MQLFQFQQLLQDELDAIIDDPTYANVVRLHYHPNGKPKSQIDKRNYALLVWFLKFYGQKAHFHTYITEGRGDFSCDIIFSNHSGKAKTTFYVVQSKNVQPKEGKNPKIDKMELNAAVAEFRQILSSARPQSDNDKFNEKYAELLRHLENNGEVKFIFFSPAAANDEIDQTAIVSAFESDYPSIRLEIIDGEKLRTAFIEQRYKHIKSANPLEYRPFAESSRITLPIERQDMQQRDIFEFQGQARAAILLLRPSTLHRLFDTYGFSLFFSNVRNPLPESNYNEKIVDTLLHAPNDFWYFNNGITAITSILPTIGVKAEKIQIDGLQVINGAQTVYSVYAAYEKARPTQRKAMDVYARISFRLIGSVNTDFNMKITRYTNMQNPMLDSDFWANDKHQRRLQEQSFTTNFWYQTRRGEFRLSEADEDKLHIAILSNQDAAASYVAFHLQQPYVIVRKELFFISRRDNHQGLYEFIFEDAQYEDILASYIISQYVQSIYKKSPIIDVRFYTILALSRIFLENHLKNLNQKAPQVDNLQIGKYIVKNVDLREGELFFPSDILDALHKGLFSIEHKTSLLENIGQKPYEQIADELRRYINENGANIS